MCIYLNFVICSLLVFMLFFLMNVLQEMFFGDIGELFVLQGCVLQILVVDGSFSVLMEVVSVFLDIYCILINRIVKMVI